MGKEMHPEKDSMSLQLRWIISIKPAIGLLFHITDFHITAKSYHISDNIVRVLEYRCFNSKHPQSCKHVC